MGKAIRGITDGITTILCFTLTLGELSVECTLCPRIYAAQGRFLRGQYKLSKSRIPKVALPLQGLHTRYLSCHGLSSWPGEWNCGFEPCRTQQAWEGGTRSELQGSGRPCLPRPLPGTACSPYTLLSTSHCHFAHPCLVYSTYLSWEVPLLAISNCCLSQSSPNIDTTFAWLWALSMSS